MRLKIPSIYSKERISFPFYSTPNSSFATATFYFFVNGCNLSDTTIEISQNTWLYLLSGLFSLVGFGFVFLSLVTKPAILALRVKQLRKAVFDHLALLEFVQNNGECYKRNMRNAIKGKCGFSWRNPKPLKTFLHWRSCRQPTLPWLSISVPSETRKEWVMF